MSDQPNPFAGLSESTHKIIEQLLHDIYAAGDWTDDHEMMLDQWREARGEAGKAAWKWWVGEVGDEAYALDERSRDDAIRCGHEEFSREGQFQIVEARMWADIVKEGEDVTGFAETRNGEVISCTLPPLPRTARGVDLGGGNG